MGWVYHATDEINDASKYPEIIAVSISFCALMLVIVTTRGVYRRRMLGWDDWIIFLSAGFSIVYTVMCVVQTRWGLGLPISLRPKQDMHTFKILSYAGKPWYQFAIGGYKLALCIGYLRLIDGTHMPNFRIATIAVAVSNVMVQLVFVLINFLSCLPVAKSFDATVPGYCLPFQRTQYPMAAVSILYDFVIFLLPIPLFLKLKMDRRTVLGLSVLFGGGLVTTVCSIIRAIHLQDVGPSGNGDNTMVVLLGSVEANVGIVMSCLPFLRALFRRIVEHTGRTILGRHSDRSGKSRSGKSGKSGERYNLSALSADGGGRTEANAMRSTSRNGSEEAILYEKPELDVTRGIVRTVHYQVREERLCEL